MTKQEAAKIVKLTFENTFDREQYVRFVTNLCKSIDTAKNRVNNAGRIPLAFADHVESIERIGKYIDSENRELLLFVVQLRKKTGIQRARTMQRNFIAWYLKHDKNLKDGAIVAFVAPDENDWRFSLIKMDYQFVARGDKTNVKEEFTPARRWSYLVGQNESSHTAQSRFVELLAKDAKPSFEELEQAFNIEKVTKEFFLEYRSLFLRVKDELDKVVKSDSAVKNDFESKSVNTVDFAKKLLGQIVFLYFLQKKGWFGVKKGAAWGSGSKQFMRELFEKKHRNYENFFNDILEPLFYDALSRDRSDVDHWNDTFQCKIPFLNGGLFDAINGYDWAGCDIPLPNEMFSNNKKINEVDRGDGVLDIFDRYNFTVCEDEPLEKEVAIDPELLGKAYEKFNAIRPDNYAEYRKALKSGKKGDESKFNKQFGVYYTPREIVHYMCQQSLIQYLVSACNDLQDAPTESDFDVLVSQGEHLVDYEAQVDRQQKETNTYKHKLPATIVKLASEIDKKLEDIKVCDPAIGSGAFPVGMMSEIVKARTILWHCRGIASSTAVAEKSPEIYQFKRQCIEESIYGVDIDPGAVEIAKLRLWLSLIVDEEDIKHIQPLPNLDYKIMQGNSLLEEFEGIKLIDEKFFAADDSNEKTKQLAELEAAYRRKENHKLKEYANLSTHEKQQYDSDLKNISASIKKLKKSMETPTQQASLIQKETERINDELKRLHHAFFEETNKSKKEKLRRQIDQLTLSLIKETLKAQSKEKLLPKVEAIERSNRRPYFLWKLHFNEVFREKGGFDVVIGNPPYGFRQIYDMDSKVSFKRIYEAATGSYENYFLFYEKSINLLAGSGVQCLIVPNTWLTIPSAHALRKFILKQASILKISWFDNEVFEHAKVNNVITLISRSKIATTAVARYYGIESFPKSPYSHTMCRQDHFVENGYKIDIFIESQDRSIIQKMINRSEPLSTFARACSGYNPYEVGKGTAPNGKPHTSQTIQERPYHASKKLNNSWKPDIGGSDIGHYVVSPKENRWVKYGSWLAAPRESQNFSGSRILVREVTGGEEYPILAGYCEAELYYSRDVIPIKTDSREIAFFLLALLNSRLMAYFHKKKNPKANKKIFPKILVGDLNRLPIRKATLIQERPLISLVDRILALTNSNDHSESKTKQAKVKDLEREIDQLVYKLYELTPEEIKIVEGANGKKKK